MIYLTTLEELVDPSIWGWLIFLVIMVGLIQLGFYVALLHRQVDKRTRHLKEAINEIQGREKQLSMIYNNMRYLIGLIGVDPTERFVIRRLPDWFLYKIERVEHEYSAQQILGMEVFQFCTGVLKLSDQKAHQLIARLKNALDRKMRVHFEDSVQLSTGYAGTAYISLIPIENKGKITNILYVARDVTRERDWQKQLQLSEERMRLAVENVPVMIDAFDNHGNLLVWNKQCEEVTGYTAEEMEGQDIAYNLLYPDRDYRNSLLNKWKGSPNDYEDETIITCKNGTKKTIRWIHQSETSPVPGWDDWGVGIDITERRLAELTLKENESHLRKLLSNLPGMVYRCQIDRDWSMAFVSEGARELTGYPAESFTSHKVLFGNIIFENDRERVWEEVQQALHEKRSYTLNYRIRKKNGVICWVWERGGELEGLEMLEGFITDVTDRIMAEERILQTVIETEDNERKRISKELHDSLGQKLTTASLNFNALKRNIKLDQNGLKKLVNGLNNLNSAIRDSRDIAHNLMPRSIENFGYVLSVESMIAEMESATNIKFEFYENLHEDRLSTSLEIHLYRITQEGVNNILKHSQAKNVIIQLMRYKEDIVLTIEDDGQGFKKDEVMNGKKNFGLRGMANRVSSLNGLLRIETLPGKGTLITIEIPLSTVSL